MTHLHTVAASRTSVAYVCICFGVQLAAFLVHIHDLFLFWHDLWKKEVFSGRNGMIGAGYMVLGLFSRLFLPTDTLDNRLARTDAMRQD
jgi:hypothetical protein